MANVLFGYPNRADDATLSAGGGSWLATLPLANMQTRYPSQVARSTNAALASTKFVVDFGSDLYMWPTALIRTNLTRAAQVRLSGSNDPAFGALEYDSGWWDVYGVIYPPGVLNFGDPGYWDGLMPQVDWNRGDRLDAVHIINPIATSRYWRWEIDDTANPDGFVEIGRLWMSYGYQPTVNMNHGATAGWTTATSATEMPGGSRFFQVRRQRRSFQFMISNISENEALVRGFDVQRVAGLDGQVFFCFDPADTYHLQRRSFLATLRELTPLQAPTSWYDQAYTVIEEL